jgi:hypothetical protein
MATSNPSVIAGYQRDYSTPILAAALKTSVKPVLAGVIYKNCQFGRRSDAANRRLEASQAGRRCRHSSTANCLKCWWQGVESSRRHADFQFLRGNWVHRQINRLPTLAITQSNLNQRQAT